MITITSVTKRFGRAAAVDDISLDIAAGESVALWGANGAGKSTLIRCVLGLHHFKGRITVGGFDVQREGKHARALIGHAPQELGFHEDLRAGEAIGLFAALRGVRGRRAADELAKVGLHGQERKRMRELSGGMKQRLALAVAMLGDPPVLVLDEVTASLDACGRSELLELLTRLAGGTRTVLFASHRVDEIALLAHRVVSLERGRVTSVTGSAEFAGRLGTEGVLHLALRAEMREPAIGALRAAGLDPRSNGIGILVPLPSGQRAVPFRVLAEARIEVDDFELVGLSGISQEKEP